MFWVKFIDIGQTPKTLIFSWHLEGLGVYIVCTSKILLYWSPLFCFFLFMYFMFYHGSSINQKIDRTLWVEQHQIDKGVKNQRLKLTFLPFFFLAFSLKSSNRFIKGTMCRNPRIQRWKRFDLKFPLNDLNILHNQIYPNLAFLDSSDNSAICWPINACACRTHEAPRFPGPALRAEEPQNRFALCSHPWFSRRNVPGRLAVHWQTHDSSLKKI